MVDLLDGGPDEMVSGDGRIRGHWRALMGIIGSLGRPALAERCERLARAMADDGVASLLPGAAGELWKLDPVPLPIMGAEFEALAAGMAQRARLLDAVLTDLYGPQELLAQGHIPASMVFGSPSFLRTARRSGGLPRRPMLHLYAADLLRQPDGSWAVLQDRTSLCSGLGQLLENRRLHSAAMTEAFGAAQPRSISPFFELWQEALIRLAPHGRRDPPAIALLSPGTRDPHWFEHVVLARELGCALVETGDLTMRGGALFLKTLAGLQPVDVLLSRVDAAALDPLDQPEANAAGGVPGILDAVRHGALTLLNAPGSGLGEAPALAAFLERLCPPVLGETLMLPSLPTHWLPPGAPLPPLPEGYAGWCFRPAGQGAVSETSARPVNPPPAGLAAMALPPLPVAPSLVAAALTPTPFVLRLFAVSDGSQWHVLPGGIARVATPGMPLMGRLPGGGWCKDVWMPADPSEAIIGPAAQSGPPIAITRTSGAIPSRVADNLFWLGRYVERLDRAARLMRAAIARLRRGSVLPRELAELSTLATCLCEAGLIDNEARPSAGSLTPLASALERTARPAVRRLQGCIGGLVEAVRDRLTADMHATFKQTLRQAEEALEQSPADLSDLARGLLPSLRFANAVAGITSENMVRGGARLFLELGRRIERAQAVASEVAVALDTQPARVEAGLRLVLELCDSVITYRSRYLATLQPAPALDLVLADPSNPRGLAFQLKAVRAALAEVGDFAEEGGPARDAQRLLVEAEGVTALLLGASDQALEATRLLPPLLREIATGIGGLSDGLTRRYFALLPPARAVGVDTGGAAVIQA